MKWCKALLVAVVLVVVFAFPVFAYTYQATYTITEGNGTAYTMLPVWISSPNQWMADNGFMLASALDTRVATAGGTAQPHMVAADRTLTAVAVPANSQTNLFFQTGESALTDMNIIVGRNGYVTTTDAAALEPGGSNFGFEWNGYFDATQTGNIIYKQDSYELTSPVAGTVQGRVRSVSTIYNAIPNAAGDYENIGGEFGCAAGSHYQCVDDPVGAPDDNTTYVFSVSLTQEKDAYNLGNPGVTTDDIEVTSVTVYFRYRSSGGATAYAQPYLRLGASETAGTEVSNASGSYVNANEALARPGGGSWTTSDLDNLQVAVGLRTSDGAWSAFITQVYVAIAYRPIVIVSQAGVTSGEHTVVLSRTTNTLDLNIDGGAVEDTDTVTFSLDDNANSVLSMANGPVAYTNYTEWTIGATLIVDYEPVTMILGTTLPDKEGAAQNGVITWGTNPAGITVALGPLVSASQPVAGAAVEEPATDILPPVTPSDWFQEPDVTGALLTHPLRPIVTLMSDTTTFTELQSWRFLGLAFVLLATVGAIHAVRGHLLIASAVCAAAILVLVWQTIWPMWALIFAGGAILGGLIAERTPSI